MGLGLDFFIMKKEIDTNKDDHKNIFLERNITKNKGKKKQYL